MYCYPAVSEQTDITFGRSCPQDDDDRTRANILFATHMCLI